jgi:Flp pilus assembly protein TadG
MSLFKRLRRLFQNERGNVLVIGAATMPLILAAAAFAIDTIQIAVWKRQIQRAADSAAIAGAYAVAAGTDTHDSVHHDLDNNRFPTMSEAETITEGPAYGYTKTVRVQITATPSLPFMKVFGVTGTTVRGDATAALADDGTFCLVSLYDGTSTGIDLSGNADVQLGCGIKTNSKSTSAVTISGSATLTATPVAAVGGIPSSTKYGTGTTLQPYSAAQVDPLAWVPDPNLPTNNHMANCSASTLSESNYTTLAASAVNGYLCVAGVDIKPNNSVTLTNITVIVNGGDANLQGSLTLNNGALILSGPTCTAGATSCTAGDIKTDAKADINITAPSSGDYKGIAMYRDRRADTLTLKVNGGASSNIQGALYFPTSDLWYNGNASMTTKCMQLVGRIITFKGGMNIENKCDPATGSQAFRQTVVRLVG